MAAPHHHGNIDFENRWIISARKLECRTNSIYSGSVLVVRQQRHL
jgi:hypothetical protein